MIFGKKPYYSYKSEKQIWRLLLSDNSKLLIEERGGDKKDVFFNLIDVESKSSLLESWQLEETQWVGVDLITDDYIFFHRYVKPDLPHHIGIILYSISEKKVVWQDENRVFEFFDDNVIYCSSRGTYEKLHFALKIDEGKIVEDTEIDLGTFNVIRAEKNNRDFSGYLFPDVRDISDPGVEKVLKINKVGTLNIAGNIEVIAFRQYWIISYHTKKTDDLYKCQLVIFDTDKEKKIVEEELGDNLKTLFFDSFFIRGNFLFVLKGKKEIVIYDL